MACSHDTDGDGHCGRRYCPECGGPGGEGSPEPTMMPEPYGALAADEQAVKAALDQPWIAGNALVLTEQSQEALAAAGIRGRTVRVIVEVTIPKGSGIDGAPLVSVRP